MEAGLEGKANTLKALANPKRLKIALLLYGSPRSFSEIARHCGFRSSELAFHLGMMRAVIKKRPDGLYELTEAGRLLVNLVQGLSPVDARIERMSAGPVDLVLAAASLAVYGLSLALALAKGSPTSVSLAVSNGVVLAMLLGMYKFRYELLEKYPYIVNLPAFSYLIMAPSLNPRQRGREINRVFRASLLSALLMSIISLLEVGVGALPKVLVTLIAAALTGIIILYYRLVYNRIKEEIGISLNPPSSL